MKNNSWERWINFKEELKKLCIENIKDYTSTLKILYIKLFDREGDDEGINYYNEKLNIGSSWGDVLKSMGIVSNLKVSI